MSRTQQADGSWVSIESKQHTTAPVVSATVPPSSMPTRGLCSPATGRAHTTYLSDALWIVRPSEGIQGAGIPMVLRRTEAEALVPQNGNGPDGFDARRFGPSGRRLWMMDTGVDESALNIERARRRMRAADEISGT
eukprot:CAMPEP_0115877636 /NCGR_PEP_ID=MMETSP0287-20121206/26331_1 /TAXON_ID=412157 /ORGANISM="Chrysochromulina rotalis, Strain UIO044" /LENGTH=135 /DNA_ID=CAMNT_0003333169 /DNA_START=32 /DNA_END=439 /DNA_ORIENTATION=-